MMFPYSKRLVVPQSWTNSNGISQRCQAKGELNFLDYFDNKRFSSEPDVVKYNKTLIAKGSSQNLMRLSTTRIVSHYMILFLVLTMKELGIAMDFKSHDNNH
jgi:hypothetical protein